MSATYQDKVRYVTGLAGKSLKIEQTLKENEERAMLVEELIGAGLDDSREALRKAMNFSVQLKDGSGEVKSIDERGQRQSIETEDVASKYRSIDPKMNDAVHKAFENVLSKSKRMREATTTRVDESGKSAKVPLFTATQILDELYVPLIREGLLPDNLLGDDDSPTARMLKAVFQSYKDMLKQQKEEREKQLSTADSNYHNAGTRTERLQSLGVKVGAFMEGQLSAVAKSTKMTPAELKRAGALAGKSVKLLGTLAKGYSEGKALDRRLGDERTVKLSEMMDDLTPPDIMASPVFGRIGDALMGIDAGVLNPVLYEVADQLYRMGWKLDELFDKAGDAVIDVLRKFAHLMETDGVLIAIDVATVLAEGVGGGLAIAGTSGERALAGQMVDLAVRKSELRSGVRDLAMHIEGALQSSLLPYGNPVARAVSGGFTVALDTDAVYAIVEPSLGVAPSTVKQSNEIVKLIATAMSQALLQGHEALKDQGQALADLYVEACKSNTQQLDQLMRHGELADPANFMLPLAERAGQVCGPLFGSEAFGLLLARPDVAEGLNASARQLDQGQEEELEIAEREIEDFERDMVLIDEGGLDTARQQSLDKMIAQLKSDQLDLDIVLKAGSLFSGVGGALTKLGTDSRNVVTGDSIVEQGTGNVTKTVATQVADSLIPALEAAQLVMKMTVTVIKIAKRAELAGKFKADVQKVKKAGSYLLPSIENFYDAKVQQQVFAGIELALQTVQLAGAICSTVPEPITMAVGRALNAAAKASEAARDLAQTAYNEKQLRDGWKVTLEAINNPANRRAGLDALYHNSTLAVHSVAWAATQGDVMAKEILRSCNVDAQTLADEGTNKDKVIEYLETLLNEDLQFKDEAKLNLDWAPQPLVLSYPGWFTLKGRARGANPPLADDATPVVDQLLKEMDNLGPLHSLLANPGKQTPTGVTANIELSEKLLKALSDYKPVSSDRTPHAGMLAACEKLRRLATNRVKDLTTLQNQLV